MAVILVIEDEEKARASIAWALESAGHKVRQAANLDAALGAMDGANPPQLIITDVVMPEWSGLDVISKIRPRFPSLGIIAISGHPAFFDIAKAHGASAALAKPFEPEQLLSVVEEVLERPIGSE